MCVLSKRFHTLMNKYKNVLQCSTAIKNFNEIPGPSALPLVGTLHHYLPLIGRYRFDKLHLNGLKNLQLYGPIVRELIVPDVYMVWLFKPEDIEILFRTDGKYPERRSHLALQKYRLDRPNVYNTGGLLPTNGPEWWKLRSIFQKGFSAPASVQSFLPHTNDIVNEFLSRLQKLSLNNDIDYSPEFSRLYLELICMAIFDVRLDAFSERELKPGSRSSNLMNSACVTNTNILKTDHGLQLWRKFDTPTYRRIKNAQRYMEEVAIDLLSLKMSIFKEKIPGAEKSILDLYLGSPELDFKDIIGIACDFLLGGVDTTTYTSSFIFYHLAKNENAQNELYKECKQLLPSPLTPITKEILDQAHYAKAVLKESLRLRPISIGVGRILNQDTIFSGYNVPKGTVVVTQNQVSCLQEQYFKNPNQFLPERWLRNNSLYEQVHPYLLLPFGHGPRSCIARRFAEQNMLVLMMKITRAFTIGWKGRDLDTNSHLINTPDGPINLIFKSRRNIE